MVEHRLNLWNSDRDLNFSDPLVFWLQSIRANIDNEIAKNEDVAIQCRDTLWYGDNRPLLCRLRCLAEPAVIKRRSATHADRPDPVAAVLGLLGA